MSDPTCCATCGRCMARAVLVCLRCAVDCLLDEPLAEVVAAAEAVDGRDLRAALRAHLDGEQ